MSKNEHIYETSDFKPINVGEHALFNVGSNYPDQDVGYNWINYAYPYLHNHDHWEIILVTSGNIVHTLNGKVYKTSKGDVFLIRPNDYHRLDFTASEQGVHICFLMRSDYMAKIFDSYDKELYEKMISAPSIFMLKISDDKIQAIINNVLNIKSVSEQIKQNVFELKLIIQDLVTTFLQNTQINQIGTPDWFSDLLLKLNNPYLQIDNVTELAKLTPYSYSRLSRLFKQATGRTIIEYTTKVKIHRAKELLKSTDMGVLEIASALNYDSISHFNRVFKEETKMTPREYRVSKV